jgi:hypothetical protein
LKGDFLHDFYPLPLWPNLLVYVLLDGQRKVLHDEVPPSIDGAMLLVLGKLGHLRALIPKEQALGQHIRTLAVLWIELDRVVYTSGDVAIEAHGALPTLTEERPVLVISEF